MSVNVSIIIRPRMYNIKVEKQSEPAGTFPIFFPKSFFMKIFKMSQTEIALNMEVFLHNIPCTGEQDIDFEKTTM